MSRLFLLLTICVFGTGNVFAQSVRGQERSSQGRPTQSGRSSGIQVQQSQGQSVTIGSNRSSGRRSGQQRRGTGQQNNGPGLSQQPRQSQNGNRSEANGRAAGRETPQGEFTENAMRFDANSDSQLAAHELRNMFVVLVTQMQQQQIVQSSNSRQNQGRNQQPSTNGFSSSSGGNGFGGGGGQGAVPQGLAIRQAIAVFLQLVMAFDANGDGQLSEGELNQFATALLQNNMNLANASAQARGRDILRSGNSGSIGVGRQQNQNRRPSGQSTSIRQSQQQSVTVIPPQQGRSQRDRGSNRQDRGGSSSQQATNPRDARGQ